MKKTCIDCGKIIGRYSTRCQACANKASAVKNSEGLKKAYAENRRSRNLGGFGPSSKEWRLLNPEKYEEAHRRSTETLKQRLANGEIVPAFRGKKHTEEFKKQQSIRQSERLRDPEKRKNYGRGKKSHMELYFENWLYKNRIEETWEYDKHFWNDEEKKNYFVDFCFEELKLIIELDGTQHRKTIELDRIRDDWLTRKGYVVIRISYEEYRKGDWETYLLVKLHAAVVQQV
ncbi:MAG: DUF559 domain-containing protein [Methanobacterium sp.]